ncbi:hypothetical protein B0H10DRAFT_2441921 [Mycena sp. CBHHK59/15]|nr:hypothetical protein B0H10DRAFT_2441921 [Mycena sp. CBHHK59/15]
MPSRLRAENGAPATRLSGWFTRLAGSTSDLGLAATITGSLSQAASTAAAIASSSSRKPDAKPSAFSFNANSKSTSTKFGSGGRTKPYDTSLTAMGIPTADLAYGRAVGTWRDEERVAAADKSSSSHSHSHHGHHHGSPLGPKSRLVRSHFRPLPMNPAAYSVLHRPPASSYNTAAFFRVPAHSPAPSAPPDLSCRPLRVVPTRRAY